MTKEETKKALAIMIASYPNYKPENMQVTLNVWNKMLEEYDYKIVEAGLMAYIKTDKSGFAPSVGQLIDCIAKLAAQDDMTEMEAWTLVRNALADSTYHSQERFDELPENVQRAVGSASQLRAWATDMNFSEGVAQSNFIKTYRAVNAQIKDRLILNADVVKLLKQNTLTSLEMRGDADA